MPATPFAAFEAEARAQGHEGVLKPNGAPRATGDADVGLFVLRPRPATKG